MSHNIMKLAQHLAKKKKKKKEKTSKTNRRGEMESQSKKIQEMRFKKKQKTDAAIRKQK